MSNGKVIIIRLIVGLIKKDLVRFYWLQFHCIKMSQYFPKIYEPFGADINVKVDLSNYATKAGIKNISHVHTSSFALKTNLASLKPELDKLDIDKLVPVPVDLSKLCGKRWCCLKNCLWYFVVKVNNVDTSEFGLKNKYVTDKSKLENKIHDHSGLVQKTDHDAKITEIEGKIPDVTNLATKTALTTIENETPDVNSLVKKTHYTTRVAEIDSKVSSLDGKIAENKTKNESMN